MKKLLRRLTVTLCSLALCLTSASALSVEQAIELLEENYVDTLPPAAYQATTLDELFKAIGEPYTYYMDATGYEEFTAGVEGETTFAGIGVTIEYTANGIEITSLLDGSGAKDAGLQVGDYIIAIGNVSCVPADETHRALILGEAGTYVTLTILHPDGTINKYSIERRTLTIPNTKIAVDNGVGTIDCDSFGSQTADYFYEGIAENDETNAWLVGLRNNSGGLAAAAVGALGSFTGPGPKLFYRLADGSSFYSAFLADQLTEKTAIVLVNGYTASASEILSGGIRAEDAGIVVGSRTYGKGSAQIVLDSSRYPELFDGDSLKITAYRFYCSDGNTTDKIGVLPTLLVSDEYTADVAALLKTVSLNLAIISTFRSIAASSMSLWTWQKRKSTALRSARCSPPCRRMLLSAALMMAPKSLSIPLLLRSSMTSRLTRAPSLTSRLADMRTRSTSSAPTVFSAVMARGISSPTGL